MWSWARAFVATRPAPVAVTVDQEAMARNLDLLLGSVGQDRGWAVEHVAEVGVWIDRVLSQHEEVVG